MCAVSHLSLATVSWENNHIIKKCLLLHTPTKICPKGWAPHNIMTWCMKSPLCSTLLQQCVPKNYLHISHEVCELLVLMFCILHSARRSGKCQGFPENPPTDQLLGLLKVHQQNDEWGEESAHIQCCRHVCSHLRHIWC